MCDCVYIFQILCISMYLGWTNGPSVDLLLLVKQQWSNMKEISLGFGCQNDLFCALNELYGK